MSWPTVSDDDAMFKKVSKSWDDEPPTKKQVALLKKFGFSDSNMPRTKGDASRVIDKEIAASRADRAYRFEEEHGDWGYRDVF